MAHVNEVHGAAAVHEIRCRGWAVAHSNGLERSSFEDQSPTLCRIELGVAYAVWLRRDSNGSDTAQRPSPDRSIDSRQSLQSAA